MSSGTYGKQGKLPGQFGWVRGIACPNENTVYADEEPNYRGQKLAVDATH
jgi:hypothetical protein